MTNDQIKSLASYSQTLANKCEKCRAGEMRIKEWFGVTPYYECSTKFCGNTQMWQKIIGMGSGGAAGGTLQKGVGGPT